MRWPRRAGDEGAGSDIAAIAKKITRWQAAEIIGISDLVDPALTEAVVTTRL